MTLFLVKKVKKKKRQMTLLLYNNVLQNLQRFNQPVQSNEGNRNVNTPASRPIRAVKDPLISSVLIRMMEYSVPS